MSIGSAPSVQSPSSQPLQPMDASSYTLTNGRSRGNSSASALGNGGYGGGGGPRFTIEEDRRFKFQPDASLPMPRQFTGGPKRYRAGRGSSVPLDLSAYE